jgi:CBS domain-containing protein
VVNLFLLVFNLVPAFPLDGGRIARAVAWKVTGDRNRGTLFSARLGQGFSYLLIGFGIYLLVKSDAFNGIWFIVMGWFLGQAAKGAVVSSRFSERLGGLTAGDLMDANPVAVPGDVSVIQAHEEWFMRYRWPWFPVVGDDGRFLGILSEDRLEEALGSGRPAIPVAELVEPGTEGRVRVHDDTPVEHLLGAEGLRTLGALMVVDRDERLRGVVTVEQVRRALSAAADAPLG